MRRVFSSLSVLNYRIYFTGNTISFIGQWTARTAQSWLVYAVLTAQSASALGLVNALAFVPGLLLSPWAGTLADRFPKRRLIIIAESILGVDALMLATLTLTGHVQLWMVFAIALIDGCASTLEAPARQAIVSEIVPLEQVPNAISLNSASFNAARALGPGIGGLLIAAVGTGPVLAINVLAFASTIIAVSRMHADQMQRVPRASDTSLMAGVRYVRSRPDLMLLMFVVMAVGGLGFNFAVSNAAMAKVEFGLGPGEFGALGSLLGVGAVTAALASAVRGGSRMRHLLIGMGGYCAFSLAAALSPSYWIFALLQIPVGLFAVTTLVGGNSMLQTRSSPEMRGRVMSFWNMVQMGTTPLAMLAVGWLGDALGPRYTVHFGVWVVGLALVIATIAFMRSNEMRIRLDYHRPLPRFWLDRGIVTEDMAERPR